GDRGEMVAEEHPPGGRHEVPAVGQPLRRGGPAVVETEDPLGEEAAVEAEADEVGPDGGEHEPGGADRLATVQGQDAPGGGAGEGDEEPREFGEHGGNKAEGGRMKGEGEERRAKGEWVSPGVR